MAEGEAIYAHILVALDGSDVAEAVLPHVVVLARAFGSKVTLVRATSPAVLIPESAAGAMTPAGPMLDPGPLLEAEQQETRVYLEMVAERLRGEGLAVETVCSVGQPTAVVVELATQRHADLIALTSHGRGGMSRIFFGSVADRILRHAPCPAIVVRVSKHKH